MVERAEERGESVKQPSGTWGSGWTGKGSVTWAGQIAS